MNIWKEILSVVERTKKIWYDHGEVAERIDLRGRHAFAPMVRRTFEYSLGDKNITSIEMYPAKGKLKVCVSKAKGITILHYGEIPELTSDKLQEVVPEMKKELKRKCKKRIRECEKKLEKAKPLLAISGGE